MKAVIQRHYGDPASVLAVSDIPVPGIGEREVLVRVRAASVHPDVWHVVTGLPYVLRAMGSGLKRPKQPVPGTDLAGVVESVGREVTRFKPGDAVFGETHVSFQWAHGGTFAEFAALPEQTLAFKPDNVSFEQAAAAATSGFITLINLQQAAPIQPGQRVLINGAGGGVGTVALQIAKAAGAHVTAVDRAEKSGLARSLGADHFIDFTKETVTRGPARYDLVFDVASNLPYAECKSMLNAGGSYIFIGHDHFGKSAGRILGSLPRAVGQLLRMAFEGSKRASAPTLSKHDAMATLAALMRAGSLTPVIDKVFELERIHEAMRCLQSGEALGRIVVTPTRGEAAVR